MTAPLNTHGLVIDVGKHAGTLYTRLPVSYLRWMVSVRHAQAHVAQAELDRRGTVTPTMDVSAHAIDRASQVALEVYLADRGEGEGLFAWLLRIATAALAGEPRQPGSYVWGPLVLVFDLDLAWPVLKTVTYSPKAAGARKPPEA